MNNQNKTILEDKILKYEGILDYLSTTSKKINEMISFYEKDLDIFSLNLLKKAILFGEEIHKNDKRNTGIPYFCHPINVGHILHEKYKNLFLTISGLLHDTSEDHSDICPISLIYENFGEKIGFIVDSVSKNTNYFYGKFSKEKFEKGEDKILFGGMKDIGVFLVKLADNQDNYSKFEGYGILQKQIRKSFELQSTMKPLGDVLNFFGKSNLIESENFFQDFLIKNNIKNYFDLKIKLTGVYYKNEMDLETLDLVLKNSVGVIWEINDIKFYEKFIRIPEISDKIEIIRTKILNNNTFSCLFLYKKGYVLQENIGKLNLKNAIYLKN